MWVDPITDRTQIDIWTRTAKAFMNVADWVRIYGNCDEIQTMINDLLALDVPLNALDEPTITTIPTVGDINALIEDIELLRAGACMPVGTGIVPLKHDYQAGTGAAAPNWQAVNAWERNLNLMHTLLVTASDYFMYCGVANCGQSRLWQNHFRN